MAKVTDQDTINQINSVANQNGYSLGNDGTVFQNGMPVGYYDQTAGTTGATYTTLHVNGQGDQVITTSPGAAPTFNGQTVGGYAGGGGGSNQGGQIVGGGLNGGGVMGTTGAPFAGTEWTRT